MQTGNERDPNRPSRILGLAAIGFLVGALACAGISWSTTSPKPNRAEDAFRILATTQDRVLREQALDRLHEQARAIIAALKTEAAGCGKTAEQASIRLHHLRTSLGGY